jgi:hypothetical protein
MLIAAVVNLNVTFVLELLCTSVHTVFSLYQAVHCPDWLWGVQLRS